MLDRIRSSRKWWRNYRGSFDLCALQVVLNECHVGNEEAVARRQSLLTEVRLLSLNEEIVKLAKQLVNRGVIPVKVETDALHIAYAT